MSKMKRSLILSLLIGCFVSSVLCGCESKRARVKESEPAVQPSSGKSISADCVVTFYKADGSRYLSEQHHLINPSGGGSIAISAQEPGGPITCRLDGGGFIQSGDVKATGMPIPICDRGLSQVIWASVAAGCDFIGEESGEKSASVKMDGQRLEQIKLKGSKSLGGEIVLYMNPLDLTIKNVQVISSEQDLVLTAKSYNYFWFEELGRHFPMKIDIFSSNKSGGDRKRILEIAYLLPVESH
jgi:hypothetical protein